MSRRRIGISLACLLAVGVPRQVEGSPPERAVLVLGSPSAAVERALLGGLRERRLTIVRPAPLDPAAAEADDPDQRVIRRVEASLGRARKLFYEVRLVDAAELLEQEIRTASATIARARRLDLLRDLQLWAGVCSLKKGDDRGARRAFSAAVLLDARPPDDVRFAPAVVETFAAVRKEVDRQPRSLLAVRVTPTAASVTVDGRPLSAPSVRLAPGPHWVVAEALGYLPTVRELRVGGNATAGIVLSLYPADRRLIRRQLRALAAQGTLDTLAPGIALALCRLQSADEALLVRQGHDGPRLRLSFTRLSCATGKVLGGQEESTTGDRAELATQRALAALWPVAPVTPVGPVTKSTRFYKRWWFWTVIGLGVAAAVGGTVGGVLAARSGPDTYTIRVSP